MTHYGRICPIETPEGPNIGLIASLSSYARVNHYGFVETPYRKVEDGVVSTDVPKYYSALDEEGHRIAQANADLDDNFKLTDEIVSSRLTGDFVMVPADRVDLMDVSPNQLVRLPRRSFPPSRTTTLTAH